MPNPYCAWCDRPLRDDTIEDHGVPYQARCYEERRVFLAEATGAAPPATDPRWPPA